MTIDQRFIDFCHIQLDTGDYDAHIPFLRGLVADYSLSREEAIWLGLLYMAYYTEGSMWVAFSSSKVRNRQCLPPTDLPITTQRRNLYGGRIQRHLEELCQIESLCWWLDQATSWQELLDVVGSVYGNGRWASYTTSELLMHLGDLDLEPSSYEIVNSSGPRKGLIALGLEPNEQSAELVQQAIADDSGCHVPPSVLESLLCDWAGMNKGTFYAGRNIDRQQGRILAVEEITGRKLPVLWEVRSRVFPEETLGELNGWQGIDKKRLKAYRDCNRILRPEEDR